MPNGTYGGVGGGAGNGPAYPIPDAYARQRTAEASSGPRGRSSSHTIRKPSGET